MEVDEHLKYTFLQYDPSPTQGSKDEILGLIKELQIISFKIYIMCNKINKTNSALKIFIIIYNKVKFK